jgi:putative Holliday junction resolvase
MIDQNISKQSLKNKHILGIDFGTKFTGLATYKVDNDPFVLTWGRIKYQSDDQLINDIGRVITDEFIDIVVIGVPFFTDGKESTMTKTVKSFISKIESKISKPLFCIDETLTTFEAEERMKTSPKYNFKVDLKEIDALSAAIIIEQFCKNSSD